MNGNDAGRLIGFACDPTASPGSRKGAEYAVRVDQYRSDAKFRSLVDDILEGLGCDVTSASADTGLVIRAGLDSPWAWPSGSTELPWNRSQRRPEHRALRMLTIVAVLAYIAPTAADFDGWLADPGLRLPEFTAAELEQFIRAFTEELEQASPDPGEGPPPIWWDWQQLRAKTATGTHSKNTSRALIAEVLKFLAKEGFLMEIAGGRDKPSAYRPRRKLLPQYRDMFVDDLVGDIRGYAAEYRQHTNETPKELG